VSLPGSVAETQALLAWVGSAIWLAIVALMFK
jgi:hypothetical protein